MRAFEMPPHAEMSLAQQLLLRSTGGRGSGKSPTNSVSCAGETDLHDRWMLPHFVWNDFQDVIADLKRVDWA
jgi:uncharacterized protein (DUF2126 family)